MEAVAAAASVAGIITLVFQSIDGLIKFKELFADVSTASKTMTRLLNEISLLIQTLQDVRDILEQFDAQEREKNLASLDIKLADCSKDVHIWLATARILRPAGEHGAKAWLKKFRLAANRNAIHAIREEIWRHKQALCLSLTVLGRNIDLHTSERIHQIGGNFDLSISSHGAQEEALKRIEHYSRASLASSAQSIRSMDTLRGELSRLEAMIINTNAGEYDGTATNDIQCALEQRGESTSLGNQALQPTSSEEPLHNSQHAHGRNISTSIPLQQLPHEQHLSSLGTDLNLGQVSFVGNWSSANRKGVPDDPGFLYAKIRSSRPSSESRRRFFPKEHERIRTSDSSDCSEVTYIDLRRPESAIVNSVFDHGTIYNLLLQSTAECCPSAIAEYISTHRLVSLYAGQLQLIQTLTNMQSGNIFKEMYRTGKEMAPICLVVRDRLRDLRSALRACRERCSESGYSLVVIDQVLFSQRNQYTDRHSPILTDTEDEDWEDAVES